MYLYQFLIVNVIIMYFKHLLIKVSSITTKYIMVVFVLTSNVICHILFVKFYYHQNC